MNRNTSLLSCLVLGFALSTQAVLDPLQFTNVSSGVAGQLNRVAYDGTNTFVAVGLNSTVSAAPFTAGAPLAWVSNSFPSGGLRLNAVTYGNGVFLAGGQDAKVFSSITGVGGWTNRNNANTLQSDVEGLAYGGGRFVAPDSFVQVFWASNLNANWNPSTFSANLLESYRDVAVFRETNFAVCGILGTIRVSTDAANSFSDNRPLNINDPDLFGIASDGANTLVSVGEAGTILYSTNSLWTTWFTATNIPATTLNGVAYNSWFKFLAVGNGGRILSSIDGVSWVTNASPVSANLRGAIFPTNGYLAGVAALVGDNGTIVLAGTRPPEPIDPMNATNCANEPNLPLCVSVDTNDVTHPDGTTTIDWFASAAGGSVLADGMATNCYTPTNSLPPEYGFSSNFTYFAQSRDLRTGFVNTNRVAVTLTIHPVPVGFNDTNVTACSDVALSYNLQTNVNNLAMGGNGVESSFIWIATDNPNVIGESTNAVSGEVITNVISNVTSADQLVEYMVTPVSAFNCTGEVFTVTVTVYPEPVGVNGATNTCSDVALNYGLQERVNLGNGLASTFSWQAIAVTNVAGQSVGVQTSPTITDLLVNTNGSDGTVVYEVTPVSQAHGCTGKVFTVTVTVYPEPVGVNDPINTCSDVALNYGLQGNIDTANGVASSFSWQVIAATNVTGQSVGVQTSPTIADLLVNTNGSDGTVVYAVTPVSLAHGCTGKVFTITATVYPEPVGVDGATNTCSDVAVSYGLQARVDAGNGVASSFSWQVIAVTNVTGQSVGVQTTPTITDLLINTNGSDGTVVYAVTPVSLAHSCTGKVFTVSVTVYPEPVGVSAVVGACDGDPVSYDLQGNVDLGNGVNSTFTWIALSSSNVSGASFTPQTNPTINDTLTDTNGTGGQVEYEVTPVSTAHDCTGGVFTVMVTVNPVPAPPTSLGDVTNCVGVPNPALVVTNIPPGATVDWYTSATSQGMPAVQTNSTSFIPPDIDEGTHSYYAETVFPTGCKSSSGGQPDRTKVSLVLQSCTNVLTIRLEGTNVVAATNVVVEWYGNLYLQSATNLNSPITWLSITQGAAGQMNAYTNPISAPLATNDPAAEFFSLTNSP